MLSCILLVILAVNVEIREAPEPTISSRATVKSKNIKDKVIIPQEINFQGYLSDAEEDTALSGDYDIIFKIYNSQEHGNLLWTESWTDVPVDGGIFNVILGELVPIPTSIFLDHSSLWLELSVEGETLSPRQKIASVGRAYIAGYADTSNYSAGSGIAFYADSCHLATNAQMLDNNSIMDLDSRWVNEGQTGSITAEMIQNSSVTSASIMDSTIQSCDMAPNFRVTYADTADYALSTNITWVDSATYADTADYALSANVISVDSAAYADTADYAHDAAFSEEATFSDSSGLASYAYEALHAISSDTALYTLSVDSTAFSDSSGVAVFAYDAERLQGKDTTALDDRWINKYLPDTISVTLSQSPALYLYHQTNSIDPSNGLKIYTTNNNTGITYGLYSKGENTSSSTAYGGYFSSSPAGTGHHYGLLSEGYGISSSPVYGMRSLGSNTGGGTVFGGYFATATAGTGNRYGLYASSSGNTYNISYGIRSYSVNTGTGDTYGGHFSAASSGSGVHYGVYAESDSFGIYAKSTSPTRNYAGYFNGNVRVSDNIISSDFYKGEIDSDSLLVTKKYVDDQSGDIVYVDSAGIAVYSHNSGKLQGKDTTALDLRYINEEQLNSITGNMIQDSTLTGDKIFLPCTLRASSSSPILFIQNTAGGDAAQIHGNLDVSGIVSSTEYYKGTSTVDSTLMTKRYIDDAVYAADDNDWDIANDVIYPSGQYGISMRGGNVLQGSDKTTHVNFGVDCTTGTPDQDFSFCTVGGGYQNTAGKHYSTVSGGLQNINSGMYSVIPGGYKNRLEGDYSFLFGIEYTSDLDSTFVVGTPRIYLDCDSIYFNGEWHNTLGVTAEYADSAAFADSCDVAAFAYDSDLLQGKDTTLLDNRWINNDVPDTISVNSSDPALYIENHANSTTPIDGFKVDVSNSNIGSVYALRGSGYAASGNAVYGVWGQGSNTSTGDAYGGYFKTTLGGSGTHHGVYGYGQCASSNSSHGVTGYALNTSDGDAYGGYFSTSGSGSGSHYGAYAESDSFGLYAKSNSLSGNYAGYFDGNIKVTGKVASANYYKESIDVDSLVMTKKYIDQKTDYATYNGYRAPSLTVSISPDSTGNYICDGNSDDAEIQAALDSISSLGGGVVYIKQGNYSMTQSITVHSNTTLRGTGTGTVLSGANWAIDVNGDTGVLIDNLKITGGGNYGVRFYDASESEIKQCWIENNGVYGIIIEGSGGVYNSHSIVVANNIFNCSGDNCICVKGYGNVIHGNYCRNASYSCIHLTGAQSNVIADNVVDGTSANYGISIADNSVDNTVTGNTLIKGQLYVYASTLNTISSNTLYQNCISLSVCSLNTVTGNVVRQCSGTQAGISVLFGYFNTIYGNMCYDHLNDGINVSSSSNNILSNNVCVGNGSDGITLTNDSDYNIVNDNRCVNNTGNGIIVAMVNCDENVVQNNMLKGNTTNSYTDNGTNTRDQEGGGGRCSQGTANFE